YPVGCPAWSTSTSSYVGDPEAAAETELQTNSGLPASCKPYVITGSTHPTNDFTRYTFTAMNTNQAFCGTTPTSIQAVGTGWPVVGNNLVVTSVSGVTDCFVTTFDFDPFKGKGDDCPTCGKNMVG